MVAIEHADVCPSCGGLEELLASTGWCVLCTKNSGLCLSCGRVNGSPRQSECWFCRDQKWRQLNADKIELYMMQGMSLTSAMEQVRLENRALREA